MITIRDQRMLIETRSLTAELRDGILTYLRAKESGTVFIDQREKDPHIPLQLVYAGNERVPLDLHRRGKTEILRYSDLRADFMIRTWSGSGIISVSEDPGTGDILVEPSAYSNITGVRSVRYDICGLPQTCELIAPLYQGIRCRLDDPMIRNSRFIYPYKWESGFVALQNGEEGMWIRTEDTRFHFRTLVIGDGEDPFRIGLETEACGPITGNMSAGSCTWRINVYRGDWTVPVTAYKKNLEKRLGLEERRRNMPDWLKEIRLAYSWCPTDPDILESLKRLTDPKRVLIHLPNWKEGGFDHGYPRYLPSEAALAFLRRAKEMGFHVGPHFNAYEIDPTHEEYEAVRDFRFREIETGRGMGWSYGITFPEDNLAMKNGFDFNLMTKIHPGHAMWRHILNRSISEAVGITGSDTVFVDVTHNVFNLDNEYVNDLTCGEGVLKLLRDTAQIGGGLCVGGEGLNEVVVTGQYFAQGHLFIPANGAPASCITPEKLCPVNALLYDGVCRIIGYHPHVGDPAEMKKTDDCDRARGFVPTLIGIGAKELDSPDRVIRDILERAGS